MTCNPRYDRLAAELLAAPDPVTAIAHLLGDHEARLNGAMERIKHLEARLAAVKESANR